MDDPPVYNEPSEATAELGGVHISGPDGVEVVMTASAAIETAKRIDSAALDALVGAAKPQDGARANDDPPS